MTDNVVEFPGAEGVDMFGPQSNGYSLIIDGRKIPKFHIHKTALGVDFILDERFSYEFPDEWAHLAASMAAQAMAIGAGYPFLGAESKDMPFAPQCIALTFDDEAPPPVTPIRPQIHP